MASLCPRSSAPRPGHAPGGVDERDHRDRELLGELHEPQRLAVALGVGHAEVAREVLLGVAAALVADDHHALAVEPREAADDGAVVAEGAVAVQLHPVGEREPQVVEREGAPRVAGHLHALDGREVAVDLDAQVGELALQRGELGVHVELLRAGEALHLVDARLELRERLLEFEGGGGHEGRVETGGRPERSGGAVRPAGRSFGAARLRMTRTCDLGRPLRPPHELDPLLAEQRAQLVERGVRRRDGERARAEARRLPAAPVAPAQLDGGGARVVAAGGAHVVHHPGREPGVGAELDGHGHRAVHALSRRGA
jgi:hypothetical protein